MSDFIVVHMIQALPPSNANRGQNGGPKNLIYGGSRRAYLSSQAQKRAARLHYQSQSSEHLSQFALRSTQWDTVLAPKLNVPEEMRAIAAKLMIGLLNVKPEKLLKLAVAGQDDDDEVGSNIVFLGNSEIDELAAIANRHADILIELSERAVEFSEIVAAGKNKKYDNHPKAKDVAPILKAIATALGNNYPGDVAIFGRMMATLPEVGQRSAVQVAHAVAVNKELQTRTKDGTFTGQVDFFSAVDDLSPNHGAGLIGETFFVSPVFYRHASINVDEVIERMGDRDAALQMIQLFLKSFVMTLPAGMQTTYAHSTLPEFVLLERTSYLPCNHLPAFAESIDEGGPNESIAKAATNGLLARRDWINRDYDTPPAAQAIVAAPGFYPGSTSLSEAIATVMP